MRQNSFYNEEAERLLLVRMRYLVTFFLERLNHDGRRRRGSDVRPFTLGHQLRDLIFAFLNCFAAGTAVVLGVFFEDLDTLVVQVRDLLEIEIASNAHVFAGGDEDWAKIQ